MRHDPADDSRALSRKRSERRRILSRVETLLLVVGVMCLVISAVVACLAAFEHNLVRARLLTMCIGYAAVGAGTVVFYLMIFMMPEWRQRRKTSRRRHGDYRDVREARHHSVVRDGVAEVAAGDGKSGMVLIYVLILVGLSAALVLQVQVAARTALKREQDKADRAELRRAAEDAARHALGTIADDDDLRVDSTNDAWAAEEEMTTPAGVHTSVRVIDQDRFFDLNNISVTVEGGIKRPDEIIGDIMVQCGQFTPSAMIDALVDWTDGDDTGDLESALYMKKTPPYGAANRVLYTWADLLAIEGFRRDQFRPPERFSTLDQFKMDINQCATILPVSRRQPIALNINTATRGALFGVFGIAEERVVNTIIVLRSFKPIPSLDAIATTVDPVLLESVRPYLDVKSSYFQIDASAESEGRTARVRALARRNASGSVDVVQWMI